MNTKPLRFFTTCAFLLSGLILIPRQAHSQVFTSADLTAPMEEMGVSARALGLGSAYVAVPDDISAMTFNPAALATIPSFQVALHHQSWLDGFSQENLMASFPIKGLGTSGLALSYLDHGTFAGRDVNGDPTGSYRSYRFSATAGWGMSIFKDIFVGLSGRGLQQSIAGKSFEAAALDGGVLWNPFKGFYTGLSYSNFGTYVDDFLLAARFRCGASYTFNPAVDQQLLACVAYSREPYNDAQLHLGLEDRLWGFMSLRCGYQWDFYDNQVSGFHGLSAGLGIRLDQITLDYAYLPMSDLGNSQRLSVQYDFGGEPVSTSLERTKATPLPTPLSKAAVGTLSPSPTPQATASPTPSASVETSVPEAEKLKLYFMVPEESEPVPVTAESNAEIKRLSALIHDNPNNAAAWMDLGRLYYRLGRKEWAIQSFEQVLRLKPGAVKLQEWLDKYKSSTNK